MLEDIGEILQSWALGMLKFFWASLYIFHRHCRFFSSPFLLRSTLSSLLSSLLVSTFVSLIIFFIHFSFMHFFVFFFSFNSEDMFDFFLFDVHVSHYTLLHKFLSGKPHLFFLLRCFAFILFYASLFCGLNESPCLVYISYMINLPIYINIIIFLILW